MIGAITSPRSQRTINTTASGFIMGYCANGSLCPEKAGSGIGRQSVLSAQWFWRSREVRFPGCCGVGRIVAVKCGEDCCRCHCERNSLARDVGGVAANPVARCSRVAQLIHPRPAHTTVRTFSRQTGLVVSLRRTLLKNVCMQLVIATRHSIPDITSL
jgi:hypothetical protein